MIPIYRAKKIDSNEWVEGYLIEILRTENKVIYGIKTDWKVYSVIEIDQSTLAIHFPNMIDKNGKKIFASLNEDGVGGDIFQSENTGGYIAKAVSINVTDWSRFEVVGIHKDNK